MQITETTSQKIKNMSLLCAAFVVMIHMGLPGGRETSTWLIKQLLPCGICRIAVPFFFVVSGFFLAAHFNETGWWGREVKKRISSLVIPFFLWSLLSIIFCKLAFVPLSIVADFLAHRPFGTSIVLFDQDTWLKLFGLDLTAMPSLGPLWYVRCLFLFVILSPLISKLVKRFKGIWLLLCFILPLGQLLTPGGEPPSTEFPDYNYFFVYGFSLSGLFYFSIGIFIQHKNCSISRKSIALCASILGITLLMLKALCFYNAEPCLAVLITMSTPFMLLAVWHFMPATKLPNWLTACSFPIYLMHVLFFPYVGFVLQKLNLTQVSPILPPTINFLVGFFGSILVTIFLRKYLPKTAKVLFGGR